jgi:methyl-accepting chemotaxis protein
LKRFSCQHSCSSDKTISVGQASGAPDLELQVNLLAEQKAAKTLETLDHLAQQFDQMMRRFTYTPDPEVAALSVSPNPEDVLKVIENAVADETGEILKEVRDKVADVTGEMRAVRGDVEEVRDRVEEVATDMDEMKERSGRQDKQ